MFSMEKSSKFQSCNVHTKYNNEEVVGSLRKKNTRALYMCIRETKLRMKLNMKFHISHKLCIINLYRWNFLNIKNLV